MNKQRYDRTGDIDKDLDLLFFLVDKLINNSEILRKQQDLTTECMRSIIKEARVQKEVIKSLINKEEQVYEVLQ